MALPAFVLQKTQKNRLVVDSSIALNQDNVFLDAAAPFFIIAGRIQKIAAEMDPLALQNYLVPKIYQLETQLQCVNIRAEKVMLVKCFICCFLDDLIEHEWIHHVGIWRAYRLLFYFFQEHHSDERVFILIDRLKQEPNSNIDLLELAYMILLYGYQGSYRKEPNGYYHLLEKIDELYQVLHEQYGDFRKNLLIA